jgi:hypothetical protein
MTTVVKPEPSEDNPLWQYFTDHQGRVIHKWHQYFDVYHNHFNRFRGKNITFLEIGVSQGGSLQMWRKYFGPQAKIYGIDINRKRSGGLRQLIALSECW